MEWQPANTSRFAFTVEGLEPELRVVGFSGREALSEPFRFDLDLASADDAIAFAAVIDHPATLQIIGQDGGRRYVNGIVSRFEQGEAGARFCLYHAQLVPALWRLGHRHNCRIFQDQSVPEIIEQLLAAAGQGGERAHQVLQGVHPKRDYCVQYRESELDFISRLMPTS